MNAADRRKITQRTGARVTWAGRAGEVTGHYDDDIIFVQFDRDAKPTRVWVVDLELTEVTSDA